MAGQTVMVIVRLNAHQIGVRIMTGRATNPLVITEEALAVRQPVRLKTDIHLTPGPHAHNRVPSTMTSTAKL